MTQKHVSFGLSAVLGPFTDQKATYDTQKREHAPHSAHLCRQSDSKQPTPPPPNRTPPAPASSIQLPNALKPEARDERIVLVVLSVGSFVPSLVRCLRRNRSSHAGGAGPPFTLLQGIPVILVERFPVALIIECSLSFK